MARQDKVTINKRSMKNVTILFGIILLFLFIILLLLRYLLQVKNGMKFDWTGFVDALIGNVIGIILPLLIFNIFYEYLVRIYSSEEISEKITETIMSNKKVIDTFDETMRRQFIKTTLNSILMEEKGDVVYRMIEPYLQFDCNLKKEFKYTIMLEEIRRGKDSMNGLFNPEDYYLIRQSLSYVKIFTKDTMLSDNISAGFCFDGNSLNEYFKDEKFFFRENLSISNKDAERIKNYSDEEIMEFVKKHMVFKAYINNKLLDIAGVEANDGGIIIMYNMPSDVDRNEVEFDITFEMPQLKSQNNFTAVIAEPTYKPQIRFFYPKDRIKLTSIPFFDETRESRVEVNELEGLKEIELDSWVMPRSGIVFIWNEKDN